MNSISELTIAVGKSTKVTVSYFALYDSNAQDRGARRNNDAEVMFGVKRGL